MTKFPSSITEIVSKEGWGRINSGWDNVMDKYNLFRAVFYFARRPYGFQMPTYLINNIFSQKIIGRHWRLAKTPARLNTLQYYAKYMDI